MEQKTLFQWDRERYTREDVPRDNPHKAEKRPRGRGAVDDPESMRARIQALLVGQWWTLPELSDELRRAHGIQSMHTGVGATIRKLRRRGIFIPSRVRHGTRNLYEYSIIRRDGAGKAGHDGKHPETTGCGAKQGERDARAREGKEAGREKGEPENGA